MDQTIRWKRTEPSKSQKRKREYQYNMWTVSIVFENGKRYFAFNIWDFDSIQAVIDAARTCECDVILQTSSRVFERMEPEAIRQFTSRYSQKKEIRAYLHLDHCRKIDVLHRAVDAGWDSVMLDASNFPIKTNIELTKQVCDYAHERGALVEAEVGQIRGVEEDIAAGGQGIADMEDIRQFLTETDIDMFAAAIGTSHGLYKEKPQVRFDMIAQIGTLTEKPFVVHGGSGLGNTILTELLKYKNVRKINISTELKQAFLAGIQAAAASGLLKADGFETMPVKEKIYLAIKSVAEGKMRLLNRLK